MSSKGPLVSNTGKRCTRLSKSDIRVQIVHSDHNATRGNDDEEDVKEPMVNFFVRRLWMADVEKIRSNTVTQHTDTVLFSSK